MADCPQCGERLEVPLVCSACRRLLPLADGTGPFEVFGLPLAYPLDHDALRKQLLELSRAMHPDFFGSADAETQLLAQRNTAELNTAYERLQDDFQRAALVLRALGGPSEKEERDLPRVFLLEVMEWNEALEAGRGARPGSPERAGLDPLAATLGTQRAELMHDVAAALHPLPEPSAAALVDVRRLLNAVRYIDRALGELAELRLEQASSTS